MIGHGRKHAVVHFIDYHKSLFVDIDEKCEPDLVFNMRRDIYDDFYGKYRNVIFINSENTIFGRSKTLNTHVLRNVSTMLAPGGSVYMKPVVYDSSRPRAETDTGFIDEMRKNEFIFGGIVTLGGKSYFTFTKQNVQ